MKGLKRDSGKGTSPSYSFSHLLLLWMVVLILVLAIGITYFDYRQAEETYQKNARTMQEQTEANIAGTITVIDSAYKMYDSSLNNEMKNAFSLFQKEYERSGHDPAKMDLDALKEALGNEMDLYIINDSIMVEYTTDASDRGLDFRQWPYSYDYLRNLLQKDGFFPDRIVHHVTTGKLVKYAYMPTPDHRYILELRLSGKALEERPHIRYQESLEAIALNNPNVLSYRAYDTMGRVIGNSSASVQSTPATVRQVISERKSLETVDPSNNTLTRYLFVDLTGQSYVSDVSWIIELVYDESELKDQLTTLLFNHALVALLAVTFTIGMAIVLSRRLTRPIAQMVHDIDTISRGDLEYPIVPAKTTEFEKITRSVTSLVASLRGMIRQLQQNELELVRRGEDYRAVVENQTELIARFLPDGTHVFANEAYCRYFGLPWPDILGHKAWPRVPREDDDLIRRHFSSLSPENPTATIEHRIISPDGREHWVQWNDRAIFDASENIIEYQSVGRDITEKKHMEEDLTRSEQKFRDLASLLPQVIFETGPNGEILYVNQSACTIFGYTPQEVQAGMGIFDVIHQDDRELAARNFARSLQGEKVDGAEYRIVRKDGSSLMGMVYSSPIESGGKTTGIRGILIDITHIKEVERDLRNLNEELERRVRERTRDLESAVRELEAFSYSVSHDLRAPLRAIDGFSSIILTHYDEALHPEIRDLLRKIRTNAQKMGDLIDSILNFSRMSRQPLSRQTVYPARIVAEQLAQLRGMRDGRDVTVRTGDLPPCEGDPVLLTQVFQNLLSNAFKFTRTRRHAEIEVGSEKQDGKTVYYVRDNGIGFDMKYASKLFTVFQRLVDEKEYEGTGIGLAIVQRIIQRHEGRVWATGAAGKGATFFFTLG
ncbi:MAG: PAS domain S-box protein [Methanolinea sp.]|nr:PAS domain S-box protein [Methanolinea sp.]